MNEIKDITVVNFEEQDYLCFNVNYKYNSEVKFIPIGTASEALTQAFYNTLYGDNNE